MRPLSWLLVLCCGTLLSFAVAAQQAPPSSIEATTPPVDSVPRLTAEDAGTWLDGFVPYAIARGDIAGAVVTVVKDGQILVRRGYGFADVEKRTPVDPDTTLFRIASISKLLTWTAVMQQVQAGKLDLDTDINQYLDFTIPGRGKPITLRHLLTHTGGFESNIKGMWTNQGFNEAGESDLGRYLKNWIPGRIFAAGTVPAYSNYGTALAGYIVARSSGLPFEQYVDQHILQPLQMQHSSFRQPLPAQLRPLVATAYKLGSGPAREFEVTPAAPAGSMSASGTDMARFMIAHLAGAAGQDTAILKAATSAQMMTPQTRFAPPLLTMALGFYESDVNGERVVAHAGDTFSFHSNLTLFRDRGVGVFISLNSAGTAGITGPIRRQLLEEFANRYFPVTTPAVAPTVDLALAKTQAKALAAPAYQGSRRSETGFGRLSMLSQTYLSTDGEGNVVFERMKRPNGQPTTFKPIAPWVWQATDSEVRLAAIVVDGKPQGFSVDTFSPYLVYQPVEGYRSARWVKPALTLAVGILGLAIIAWPIAAIARRYFGRRLDWSRQQLRAWRLSRISSLLLLLVPAIALAVMSWASADFARVDSRLNAPILLIGSFGVLAVLSAIATTAWNLLQTLRRDSNRGLLAKIWAALMLLSAIILSYVLWLMGVLDFATRF